MNGAKGMINKAFDTKKLEKLEAVFLNINSPGGSPVQTELIADYIQQKANKTKVPVVSFVEDVAGSGGYWLGEYLLRPIFYYIFGFMLYFQAHPRSGPSKIRNFRKVFLLNSTQ